VLLSQIETTVCSWLFETGVMGQQQPEARALFAADYAVVADDRVLLNAAVDGPPDAPVTVVLCHGYGLNRTSWRFQRAALAGSARVVTWDQRGHGRSEYGGPGSGTIGQLGRDLYQVIRQVVPDGPVVLVGHSMGGMAIMALAEDHPELFGHRVVAVALLATSAGPLKPSLGLPVGGAAVHRAMHHLAQRVTPDLQRVTPDLQGVLKLFRRLPGYRPVTRELARRFGFASSARPEIVDLVLDMLEATPLHVAGELFAQFRGHDKRAALQALCQVRTLVMVGAADLITPPSDSEEIASAVPGEDLVVVPHAGHALILERPELVNRWLMSLVEPRGSQRAC
jgi:pimeloyl-ACP methyl ester carboxylesterase